MAEPWRAPVFLKKFDAHFFIQFPHNQYGNEPIEPFGLLNNLQESKLFISTPNGSKNIEFQHDWSRMTDFFDIYKEKLAEDRFLFWHGTTDRWAMVSDSLRRFAVIGIDWKLADQPAYFYKDFLLSNKKVAELLGDARLETAISENYAPSKWLTESSDENPMWVKYHFCGKVETEDDKLFYWRQFEPLFGAVSAVLADFKSQFMWADQHFSRRYFMNKQWYSSNAQAPVGGWQKFSHANCDKVANKFLPQNRHLQLRFDGKRDESEQLFIANKKGLIEFMFFWIYAALEKRRKPEGWMDFYFIMEFTGFGEKTAETNQDFQFFYLKSAISDDKIEKLVADLVKIGFVKKIYRMERPVSFWKTDAAGLPEISHIYSESPDFGSSAELFRVG